ncbi:Glucoamylase (glucan-1,4-alpha-glucosidase), GH15 family [Streptomyces sp. MnatMP-M77]|uniref:Trehalase n=1 Tax=Streptomyces griseus subsp. griseus (strain JCM 4626 / CBS 651.72 / NBRC 13350 / KCC S-0626 / ISP 5235) TaxID=455632 RepID=B1W202_STRGG|nr:glycoside hydrolase 15-related protein [Streptomyces sp. ACT-1]SBU94387.1 Glucoamylase (glucan-1,4-alpha-glucosidase), GH15 family [Streptomyces sp. MnatMP-M77]SCE60509.1 Glucoamylase (glucan-1,4-alpha-glucosidase), GH15 family [Streptomyces sp. OspMP-M43]SEE50823.1 Glucoamylase (glucan-1,4-alpha-glucosidase), GH15 family [Streptomyces griseus]BAG22549.1 putative glycosyl hydrolase [Streptomyces griseus subsp. griseus NBRC 13350]
MAVRLETHVAGRIEDYALIGDMQTAALVCRDGTADWLCLPRFDSHAVFAGLLGTEEHGFWRLGPARAEGTEPASADRRRYRGDSLVLESEWDTPRGTVRVTDFMPPRDGAPQLIRIVEGVSGRVPMRSELRMRFSYGRVTPWVHKVDNRTVAVAGPDSVWLDTEAETYGKNLTTYSDFTVGPGERVAFTISWQPSHHGPPALPEPEGALEATELFWREWVDQCTYHGPYREAVVRSLITLKALTYAPTGGIVAAPTTSLPEEIGGVRNWDYRYTWLRDAAITLSSLLRTGYREEARAWREWLLRAVAGDPENLQIMYGIAGERELGEAELDWLPGYENSTPVRVGNGAANQLQLDVYGEVTEALHLAHMTGLTRNDYAMGLQLKLIEYLEKHWEEPDEGIWEVRGPRRHFVHSKVMAWVAVDRTIKLVESGDVEGPLERWHQLRDDIHRDVCERGYDKERNTFTQSYGSKELDASLLLIPQMGFLPPDDKRVIGTIEAIQRELSTEDGFILRYPTEGENAGVDGLAGDEGAFLACSFWMADDLAMIGRVDEARQLFEKLLSLRNDLGLLAEEWDSNLQRQVGNFPQAFSHVPLIDTALRLTASGAYVG